MLRQAAAQALMGQIVHQLRLPAITTMAPCKRCASSSPGGQLCANCLCDDLGQLIRNHAAARRWLDSLKRTSLDQQAVISCAGAA